MKKTIALLTALLMLGMTACGKIDSSSEEKSAETTAETTAPKISRMPDNVEPAKNAELGANGETDGDMPDYDPVETQEDDSSQARLPREVLDVPDIGSGFVGDSNCLIVDQYQDDENTPYDKETLYRMAELAVKQCNCAVANDKKGWFELLNVPGLLLNENTAKILLAYCVDDTTIDTIGGFTEIEAEIYTNPLFTFYTFF